jgi:hypothetical protein
MITLFEYFQVTNFNILLVVVVLAFLADINQVIGLLYDEFTYPLKVMPFELVFLVVIRG